MKNHFGEQKENFHRECRTINLRFEYPQYTGVEIYAIVTNLSEAELIDKYDEVIKQCYSPYILLNEKHGQAITEYQNIEAKYRMRNLRFGHAFDVNDGNFEEHHPELAVCEDIAKQIEMQDKVKRVREVLNSLPEVQKRRLIKHFFYGKSSRKIAKEEGVNYSAVDKSIALGIKNLRKLL